MWVQDSCGFQLFLYPSCIFCLCLEPFFLNVWDLYMLDSIAPRSRRILQQMGCCTNNASGTTSAARRGQEVMLQNFSRNPLEIESMDCGWWILQKFLHQKVGAEEVLKCLPHCCADTDYSFQSNRAFPASFFHHLTPLNSSQVYDAVFSPDDAV